MILHFGAIIKASLALPAVISTEGGVMPMELIFLTIIGPIITGCIVTAFKYWLDNRNRK